MFAPATVANLGPGFDVLGLALSRPGDELEAEISERSGVEIVDITGDNAALSRDPQKNVIGRAAADVLRRARSDRGVRLWLHKQMPLASGLGSSGASSAAAAVAVRTCRIGIAACRQRWTKCDGRNRARSQLQSV